VCSLQRSASLTIECGLGSFDEFLQQIIIYITKNITNKAQNMIEEQK